MISLTVGSIISLGIKQINVFNLVLILLRQKIIITLLSQKTKHAFPFGDYQVWHSF